LTGRGNKAKVVLANSSILRTDDMNPRLKVVEALSSMTLLIGSQQYFSDHLIPHNHPPSLLLHSNHGPAHRWMAAAGVDDEVPA
jgi:hypothetical protein